MKPEAQRIAIAEACGWGYIHDLGDGHKWGTRTTDCGLHVTKMVPDYLNDLNAMREAEKVLTKEQRGLYLCISYDIVIGVKPNDDTYIPGYWEVPTEQAYEQMTMSAAQRAEAFLRTLGKWEEAP